MNGVRSRVGSLVVIPAFCALATGWTSATSDTAAASAFRITYYNIAVRLDPDSHALTGCVRAVGRTGNKPLDALAFDLASSMIVDSASARGTPTARTIDATRNQSMLSLKPSTRWSAGEHIDVTVCYHGIPSKDALLFAGGGDSARIGSYGLPYSAREWWPSRDSPAEKVDSVDIEISAPVALTAVSNGRLVSRSEGGDGIATTRWAVRYPIYPDVVSLAVARYASFTLPAHTARGDSLAMVFFVFPEDEVKARQDFSVLPDIMAHHIARFGDYPFAREKYGVAEFPIQSFREHQTLPSYGPRYITGDHRNDWILAHELAHQWFGDALSVRNWSDAWLNEGFATYAAFLWIEQAHGKAAYDSAITANAKFDFTHSLVVGDSMDIGHMFDRVTFSKGALVLHMLRHVLGDERFFRAIRTYIARNRYGNVSTAAFQQACEHEFHRSLDWFFAEWVRGTGIPAYESAWTQHRSPKGFVVDLTVRQLQNDAAFTMPIDVAFITSRGTQVTMVMDSLKTFRESIAVPDSVVAVSIDPGNWIMKRQPQP